MEFEITLISDAFWGLVRGHVKSQPLLPFPFIEVLTDKCVTLKKMEFNLKIISAIKGKYIMAWMLSLKLINKQTEKQEMGKEEDVSVNLKEKV